MSPEITLPLSELKPILPGLGRVIPQSRTLPVLQSVRVRRTANGVVTLEATDLETHLTYHMKETQPGGAAEVLVPFDTLNKTAKGAGPTLTLIPEGLDKVRLRSHIGLNPVEQRLSTLTAKEWPETPPVTAQAVPLDARFGATLKEALQCASDDNSRLVLQGVCVDVSDPQGSAGGSHCPPENLGNGVLVGQDRVRPGIRAAAGSRPEGMAHPGGQPLRRSTLRGRNH